MSRSPLPCLLLFAPLIACSESEPDAPQPTVRHGVDLVVAEYVTVDEDWYVDELNHVHAGDVAVEYALHADGEIRVELRPMRTSAGFSTELLFFRNEADEADVAILVKPFRDGGLSREPIEDLEGNVWINAPWEEDVRMQCEFSLHGYAEGEPVTVRGAFAL